MIGSWILGAVIYIGGAGLIVLGENLIKRSSESSEAQAPVRIWLLGCCGFLAGNAMHFVAFMFAAQSMLEALGSSVLLWNLLFARLVNNEKICSEHVTATLVILMGASIALVWGPHGSAPHTFDQLLALLTRPQFLLFEAVLAAVVGCLQVIYSLLDSKQSLHLTRHEERDRYSYLQLPITTPAETQLLALSFAGVSAGVGSHSVILSKCMAEALRSWADGQGTTVGISAVIAVGVWALVTAFWLYRLNKALTRFPALFIVPTLHAIWMCCSILGGAIFFDEFHSLPLRNTVLFGTGVATVLVGVALMPVSHESSTCSPDSSPVWGAKLKDDDEEAGYSTNLLLGSELCGSNERAGFGSVPAYTRSRSNSRSVEPDRQWSAPTVDTLDDDDTNSSDATPVGTTSSMDMNMTSSLGQRRPLTKDFSVNNLLDPVGK